MKNNLKTLLGYLLEETVSQRPFDLSLDNLVAHRDALFDAYVHCVYRGKCSKSSGPIVVVETEDGKYQLIDGYHRLIEHLLDHGGASPILAIIGGEGSGEYAIARGGERWVGRSRRRYGNLEDLTNKRTLAGHAKRRKTAKSGNYWYHTTSRENAEKIKSEGLRINPSGGGKSRGSLNWMREAYGGITPIFLSRKPGRYLGGVVLKVDVSGLDLVADIPGLVDFGGRLTEDSIYWDEEETPEELWDLMDPDTEESVNGELLFEWLREPNNDISGAAIGITDTAAVMEDIGPERIEAMDMIVEGLAAPENKKLLLLVHPDAVFEMHMDDTNFIKEYMKRLRETLPTFDYVITHLMFSDRAPEAVSGIRGRKELWDEFKELLKPKPERGWIGLDHKFSASFSDALPDYLIDQRNAWETRLSELGINPNEAQE